MSNTPNPAASAPNDPVAPQNPAPEAAVPTAQADAQPEQNASTSAPGGGKPQRSFADRILRAGLVVIGAHLILKLLSLALQSYLSKKFGIGVVLDSYALVYTSILSTVFLTGEEALGPAFLPTFMALKDGAHADSAAAKRMGADFAAEAAGDDPAQREWLAWGLARSIAAVQLVVVSSIIAVCVLWPGWVVNLWMGTATTENAEAQAKLREMATELLRLSAGGLVGWSLGSLTYLLLDGYKKFFLAALGDSMLKVGVLTAAIFLGDKLNYGALGVGIMVGGTLKLLLHLFGLRRQLLRSPAQWNPAKPSYPPINFRSPAFREFCWLLLPLAAAILLGKVRDRFYVEPLTRGVEGVLAAKTLGRQMFDTIGHLIPYALSIAMYPFFCDMVDRGDRDALGSYLTKATRMVIVLFLLMGVGVFFLAQPASALLFYHLPEAKPGMDAAAVQAAAQAEALRVSWIGLSFWVNAIALPAAAVEMFQMQAYFSNRKLWHAQLIGIGFSILAILITLALTSGPSAVYLWGLLGLTVQDPVTLISGVSIAFVMHKTLKVVVLGYILRRHVPVYPAKEMAWFFLRLLATVAMAAVALWGVTQGVGRILPQFGLALDMAHLGKAQAFSRLHLVAGLALSAMGGLAAMIVAAELTGLREFREIYHYVMLKVRRKKP